MEIPLPASQDVAVDHLAGSFNEVTNSYKFFWFLAILEHIETNQATVIPIKDLLAQMVAFVWYPTNYYLLSFGKQDQLRNMTERFLAASFLKVDAKPVMVKTAAMEQIVHRSQIGQELSKLGDYVPYRSLRPFVGNRLRGLADWKVNAAIAVEAEQAFKLRSEDTPYRFIGKDAIELSPPWQRYFSRHHEILTGFCFWRLINYLQRNNPNVTNIAVKLFAPEQRDLKLAKRFWNTVLSTRGSLSCIYSGRVMTHRNYSLDHWE
jgi:hypothetical protein